MYDVKSIFSIKDFYIQIIEKLQKILVIFYAYIGKEMKRIN